MKFTTQYNYQPKLDRQGGFSPSVATPDQSLSMTDILRRYEAGQSLTMNSKQFSGYDLEEELPNLRKMDLSEIQELKEQNDQKLREIREEMVKKQKERKELLEAQAKEKWFNDELERRNKNEELRRLAKERPSEEA